MLIEFTVANFRSVRARQTLSLVASTDTTHLERNTVAASAGMGGLHLLRSAVIYGPNAAGKSNLLLALETLRQLVLTSSSSLQEGARLPLNPFLLADTETAPCQFEIVFALGDTRYHYYLEAWPERVSREWLIAYPHGRPQRWFEREYKPEPGIYEWWFGPNFKAERKQRQVWQNSTRANALFLSTAVQLNSEQLRPIFDWFANKLIVLAPGIDFNPFLSLDMLREESSRSRLMRFMETADVGIDRLELREEDGMPPILPLLPGQMIPPMPMKRMRVLVWHKRAGVEGEVALDLTEESQGTQKLFEFAGGWLRALDTGATLFVDELDRSLHPKLTRFLVELFNCRSNEKKAQLVFTTHDTTLLDPDILRRDQIWFVEKDAMRSTHLYSLLDYSPRKDEALERGYLKGRYGAVPFVGKWEW
jgi:hypothetical protein